MADIDALWDWGDPVGSESRFRDALADAIGSERNEILTQIARAQGLQGNFDAGHTTLAEICSHDARVRIRVWLERGRLLNSSGQPEAAVPEFLAAAELATDAGEAVLEIDALHMLGIAAPVEERIGWNERAIVRAEASEDPAARRWLGSLMNNTAWAYHDAGDFDRALEMFVRARDWHEEYGSLESRRIARWSVGRAMRSLGEYQSAFGIQEDLAAEIGDVSPDGYVFEEIAENLLALGRAREAAQWSQRAAAALGQDSWLVEHEPDRLARLRRLSGDVE